MTAFYWIFDVILSVWVAIPVQTIQFFLVLLQLKLDFRVIPLSFTFSWGSFLSLAWKSFFTSLFHRHLLVFTALQMFAMIQVTDVFLKKFDEQSFLSIKVGRNGLSKVAFNRRDSFLPIFVRQGLIHFILRTHFFDHFTRIGSLLRCCQKLLFDQERFRVVMVGRLIVLFNLLWQNDGHLLVWLATTLCVFEVWLFFWYLFVSSVFLIQFVSLCDLFILIGSPLIRISFGTSGAFVFWSILFEFQLFFDVVQVCLIHVWKNIVTLFLVRST